MSTCPRNPQVRVGTGPSPFRRTQVIQAQVEEIRRRHREGILGERIDPELLRMLSFATASHPRLLPQVTRVVTGWDADDPRFGERWAGFLREVGAAVQETSRDADGHTSAT